MSDISTLSDAELQALYQKAPSVGNDLSQMSDADLMKAYAAPKVGRLEDAAKSIGAGLENNTISTLGGPGDAADLLARGSQVVSNYVADKLGWDRGPQMTGAHVLPTSQDIRSTVTDPIVSPDYQPQYGENKFLKKATEFSSAAAQGPGGLGRRVVTNVIAPAIGSTIGEEVGGPVGSVLGAVAGGASASKIANAAVTSRALKAATPALADVKAEASNAYDALTNRNVAIPLPQSELDNVTGDITATMNRKGIRPSNAGSIHQAIDEIKSPATAGAPDVADLVAGRQSIKQLLSDPDANKAGAFIALNKIDNAIERNSPGTMASLREADQNWSAFRTNEALDSKIARAELRAAGADSGMNLGNKIRQKVADLLLSNDAKYLSAQTKAELEKIVRGTATQNVQRMVAGWLGGGGGIGTVIAGGAGYEAGGWPGALAGAAVGRGFKIANNRSVAKQAELAAQNIRMRSPLGQQTPYIPPPLSNPALTALLPALLARPKQSQ